MMVTVTTYATRPEAELARIRLEIAGIPSTIMGVDTAMEGGIAGVKLQVPEEHVAAATEILEHA
jgi:hypothetical protein